MSDAILHDIFYFHKDIMLLTEKETGKIVKANYAAIKFYGYDEKHLFELNVNDLTAYKNGVLFHKMSDKMEREVNVFTINLHENEKEFSLLIIHEIKVHRLNDNNEFESVGRIYYALENAGDGVWDRNLETDEVFFSKKWKEMLGFDENEISNSFHEWSKRVHPDDAGETMRQLKLHLEGIIPFYRCEYRILCKDGSYKWILDRGKITAYDNGKPVRMTGIHTDLSEQKKIEEELNESNKRKDTLLSIVSHDLRGPIGSFKTLINFILENYEHFQKDEIFEIVKDMNKTSSSIYDLLDNLLKWSKLNRDRTNIRFEKLKIMYLIKYAEENIFFMLESKNISLKTEIDDVMTINADKESMIIIIRNILSNAVKFSYHGSSIEIKASASHEGTVIEFTDHGKGIGSDVLEKLNTNSLRVSNFGTDNEKGSGLGLSLCREMLKLNNGMLEIESEEGKGTRVKLIFL